MGGWVGAFAVLPKRFAKLTLGTQCRAYKSVYGLEIPKYRLITDPYLKKIQTKYGLYLTEIQT